LIRFEGLLVALAVGLCQPTSHQPIKSPAEWGQVTASGCHRHARGRLVVLHRPGNRADLGGSLRVVL